MPARLIVHSDYDPLVVLQPGRAGAVPLFCIAGAGASVTGFFDLVERLPEDLPVLGLQARGLDGADDPFLSVETAAAVYFDAVRAIWPSGPYWILGHSFGGWVAFELAGLFATGGHEVEALLLVDSEVPYDSDGEAPQISRVEALIELVDLYELLLSVGMRLTREDFEGCDERAQITLLEQELIRVGVLPHNAPGGLLDGVVTVFETNLRTTYRAKRVFEGTLKLASAAETDGSVAARIAGWRRATSTLCHTTIPGNHVTMLLGENAEHLADWIGTSLGLPSDGA